MILTDAHDHGLLIGPAGLAFVLACVGLACWGWSRVTEGEV